MNASKLSGWRKVAAGMWGEPNDPQIYGALEIDATPMLRLIERARADGHRITPTHFVGRALALALREVPDLNVRLVGGRAVPRPSVDIFMITSVGGGRDLSGVKIERADEKSVIAMAEELGERARALKAGKDPAFAQSKKLMDALPLPVLRVALRLTSWITAEHAVPVPALKLEASPFGSALVSSIGTLGLPIGFVPLAWMYRVPILIVAGEIAKKPVAIDDRVEVRPMLPISATIDHRYADGWHISKLLQPFRGYLQDPTPFEPAIATAKGARDLA